MFTPTLSPLYFGFGGIDENGQPRPLPNPRQYTLDVHGKRLGDILPTGQSPLVEDVYERVFRKDLTEPSFTLFTGLGKVFSGNRPWLRIFQMALGEQVARLRSKILGVEETTPFSLKYMGRSNKVKKNPLHCDTRSTDSFVLMLYEPAKNIKACASMTDLTQYALDHQLDPRDLVTLESSTGEKDSRGEVYRVKSHYGHQIKAAHHEKLLALYAHDLKELMEIDPEDVALVAFNDSVGREEKGLAHVVRHLEVPDPSLPSERPFNHVVYDIHGREMYRDNHLLLSDPQPATYFKKALPAEAQIPVSAHEAIGDYVATGEIYYRNPRI